MEQLARVKKQNDDGTAQVLVIRESACSGDCHKCSGCGAVQQQMLLQVENRIGAAVGDRVIVTAKSAPVLAAAAVLYLLPMALFFLGYLAGDALWQQGPIAGCALFALGIFCVIAYDRKIVKKQDLTYTITGFAESNISDSQKKGDNCLD